MLPSTPLDTQETSLLLAHQRAVLVTGTEDAWADLASHPSLHPSLQEELTRTSSYVCQHLASREDLTLPVQWLLAQSSDWWVRSYLSENAFVHVSVQEVLAKDPSKRIRSGVARFTTDPTLQAVLSYDLSVRLPLHFNENLHLTHDFSLRFWREFHPQELLNVLARQEVHPDWSTMVDQWEGSLASFVETHRLLSHATS